MRRTELYDKLIKEQDYKCGICGGSLEEAFKEYEKWKGEKGMRKSKKRITIDIDCDHKIPKSKLRGIWWRNDPINLQLTHKTCNNKKGNNL